MVGSDDFFWDGATWQVRIVSFSDFSMTMGDFSMILGDFSMIMGTMIMAEGIETCLPPKKTMEFESSTFDLRTHGFNLCGCFFFTSVIFWNTGKDDTNGDTTCQEVFTKSQELPK